MKPSQEAALVALVAYLASEEVNEIERSRVTMELGMQRAGAMLDLKQRKQAEQAVAQARFTVETLVQHLTALEAPGLTVQEVSTGGPPAPKLELARR